MNNNYCKALDKLLFAISDVRQFWEEGQKDGKSFEDRQAYHILESVIENMDMASDKLKRYTKTAIEGKLQEDMSSGKFELLRNDTGKGLRWDFSCGNYLEVWDNEEMTWRAGRVEHAAKDGQKGYYFHNYEMNHPFLYTGMRARVRPV